MVYQKYFGWTLSVPYILGRYMQGYLKKQFKLSWREASPPNHRDDKVHSDQYVVNKELSLP